MSFGENLKYVLSGMAEEELAARFKIVVDGVLNNKEMVVTIVKHTDAATQIMPT